MRLGIVGLGLIGGSMALALRDRHDVVGYDRDESARALLGERGVRVVASALEVFPADCVVVATPLAAIVPTLEALVAHAGTAVLLEVGSLKGPVAAFAERAPRDARIVGLHPMAGSTRSGPASADAGLFRERPFLAVPTARSDEAAMELVGAVARDLGGRVTVCSTAVHDRAIAAVSALPLAAAVALERTARAASPLPLDAAAGPGLRDSTRLARTPPDLALPLLAAPGLREHIASLREALAEIERALGDDDALRALLDRSSADGSGVS